MPVHTPAKQVRGEQDVVTRMPDAPGQLAASSRRSPEVRDAIHRRSVSVYARMRVADAIRLLALDICGDESMSAADRARLAQAIAGPVNEATEEALRVLIEELVTAFDIGSARLRPTMLTSDVRRIDFE